MSNDRFELSTLVNDMAMFNEVAGISVYSVDNQLLAVAGNFAPRSTLPTFSQEVTVQDTVAGYVRIMINPDAFQTSFSDKFMRSVLWCASGLLALVGIMFGLLLRTNLSESDDSMEEGVSSEASAFILVVNVFNQISLPAEARARAMSIATARSNRVANLYAAQATPLAGTGVALAFDQTDAHDRSFEVVCAALLLGRALDAMNHDHYTEERPEIRFRFGLHVGPVCTTLDELLSTDNGRDTVLLSALASDGHLAVSEDVMASITRTERIIGHITDNPAAAGLISTSRRYHLVERVAPAYQSLIERQAELIIAQAL
ncbi:MAG: hypothetical protein VB933_09725 [Pseudomonadales bacterium]